MQVRALARESTLAEIVCASRHRFSVSQTVRTADCAIWEGRMLAFYRIPTSSSVTRCKTQRETYRLSHANDIFAFSGRRECLGLDWGGRKKALGMQGSFKPPMQVKGLPLR